MSTTFAVSKSGRVLPIIDDSIGDDFDSEDMTNVAYRYSVGIYFTNPIAHLLPNDTPVYATDNTQQGIYTIGDIKNESNH